MQKGSTGWLIMLFGAATLALACGSESDSPRPLPESASEPISLSTSNPSRPELILLISLDTLRADHLGTYGYDRPTSPFLDALAEGGTVFEGVSATSPWTLPSHASMMTGLYPNGHGAISTGSRVVKKFDTIASLTLEAGYETFAVVNTPWLRGDAFGFMRGFENTLYVPGGESRVAPNAWVTDQAIDWITQENEKPKFVFVHYLDIHSDYASKPKHEGLFVRPYEGPIDGTNYQLTQLRITDEFLEGCRDKPESPECFDTDGNSVLGSIRMSALDDEGLQHLIDLYDAGIHQMDEELGRLFRALEEKGWRERAVIIVTSDHGEEFMEHGNVFHSFTQYQEVLRVPLIISGPGIPAGVRISTPVSLVDIAPTILGLARAGSLRESDGLDLAPLWKTGPSSEFTERDIFAEAPMRISDMLGSRNFNSMRRGQFSLHHELGSEHYELYDLASDPQEVNDLSSSRPELLAEMRERYLERLASDTTETKKKVDLSDEDREALRALGYLH